MTEITKALGIFNKLNTRQYISFVMGEIIWERLSGRDYRDVIVSSTS